MTTADHETFAHAHDKSDIQGGLVGFNKDFQRLVYVSFPSAVSGRAFLASFEPLIATAQEVLEFNDLYKRESNDGKPSHDLRATWTNIWLSDGGLAMIEAPGIGDFPEDFRNGMAAQAALIGDTGRSDKSTWVAPFTGGAVPDAVVVVAADLAEDLDVGYADVQHAIAAAGVTEISIQNGAVLPDRREHFGFKDGISQPGIKGLTVPSKAPHDEIATGEFLIGYPDEEGHVSGQPTPPPPPPSDYNPSPAPPLPAAMPPWAANGSFVVLRRLQQDVGGFRNLSNQQPQSGLSAEQLAAKLVGRWPSGAPMEHVPGEGRSVDPSVVDPLASDAKVTDDQHVNNFTYDDDPDGIRVPRAAHIRKTNPRSKALPDGDNSNRHRIMRRGIPYGTPFVDGAPPYGSTVPPEDDRGLLFICYQASISDGFAFIQARWANVPTFQQAGDGEDAIISQDNDPRAFRLPTAGGPVDLSFAQWVVTTGGGYFFSPARSAIRTLSTAAPTS